MKEQFDLQKVLAYAKIIDIHNEMIDSLLEITKRANRWKYRPVKSGTTTWRRISTVLVFAMRIKNLAAEKQSILFELKRKPIRMINGGLINEEEMLIPKSALKQRLL